MMRMRLDEGSVKRLVSVWRETMPVKGEKTPKRVAVDSYAAMEPRQVAFSPHVVYSTLASFLIDEGPDGDKLLAALREGPVKVGPRGDAWVIDVDRVERARA